MPRDFAPISRDQSVQVRLASAWLIFNAVITLGVVGLALVAGVTDPGGAGAKLLDRPLVPLLLALWGWAMFRAGRALARRSRLGGYAGLVIYFLPLLLSAFTGGPSLEVLIVSVLGLVAILTAWSYLEGTPAEFGITTRIDAPPSTVWEVMRDVERWPEWTASITRVELVGGGPMAVGSRARIRQPGLPPATWEVTELMEGREFSWDSRAPGILVTARHSVEPSGTGTSATLTLTFDGVLGPLLGWLTRKVNARYLGLEAAGLKQRSEWRHRGNPPERA